MRSQSLSLLFLLLSHIILVLSVVFMVREGQSSVFVIEKGHDDHSLLYELSYGLALLYELSYGLAQKGKYLLFLGGCTAWGGALT